MPPSLPDTYRTPARARGSRYRPSEASSGNCTSICLSVRNGTNRHGRWPGPTSGAEVQEPLPGRRPRPRPQRRRQAKHGASFKCVRKPDRIPCKCPEINMTQTAPARVLFNFNLICASRGRKREPHGACAQDETTRFLGHRRKGRAWPLARGAGL